MTITPETIAGIARGICLPSVSKLDDFDYPLLEMGLDSLDYVTFLMALEDKYEILITDEDLEDLNTINKLAAFINESTRR